MYVMNILSESSFSCRYCHLLSFIVIYCSVNTIELLIVSGTITIRDKMPEHHEDSLFSDKVTGVNHIKHQIFPASSSVMT